jgi:hypothetical protein
MRWTKAVAVAACLAAGAAFAQGSTSGGTTATPDKSTDTTKSDPAKMESKSTTKDPKAAPKGTTADKDKDTSATGTGGSSSDPAKK